MLARIHRSRPILANARPLRATRASGSSPGGERSAPHCTLGTASNSYVRIWRAAPTVRPDHGRINRRGQSPGVGRAGLLEMTSVWALPSRHFGARRRSSVGGDIGLWAGGRESMESPPLGWGWMALVAPLAVVMVWTMDKLRPCPLLWRVRRGSSCWPGRNSRPYSARLERSALDPPHDAPADFAVSGSDVPPAGDL
jgi:hypothetical protein